MLGIKLEDTRVYREAREEEREKIALNMLRKSMLIETIAEVTGLTIDRIQQLQLNNTNDRS